MVDGRLTIPIDVRQRWLQEPIRNFEWKKFSQSSMRITVTAAQLLQELGNKWKKIYWHLSSRRFLKMSRILGRRPCWQQSPRLLICHQHQDLESGDARIHRFANFWMKFTLQGTNISPKNGILKMIFLFPRWDMFIPWRVPS